VERIPSGTNFVKGDSAGHGSAVVGARRDVEWESRSRSNYVPLYKWGLTFTGQGVSNANQFLERVEELADTRRVTRDELFQGILELLSGDALIWYRVHRLAI